MSTSHLRRPRMKTNRRGAPHTTFLSAARRLHSSDSTLERVGSSLSSRESMRDFQRRSYPQFSHTLNFMSLMVLLAGTRPVLALAHLPVSRRDAFSDVLAKAKSNHVRLFASLPPHCHVKCFTCCVCWTDAAGFHRLLFQSTVTWHPREGRHAKYTRAARTARVELTRGPNSNVTPLEPLVVSLRLRPRTRSRPVRGATESTNVAVVVGAVGR